MSGALDLSGVARAIDGWLVDEVILVRDHGVADDHLNAETLQLEPAPSLALWGGTAAVQPMSGYMAQADPDVARVLQFTEARHRVLLALGSAPQAQLGDLFTVTAVNSIPGDPDLIGGLFEIVEFGGVSSFAVMRVIYVKQVGRTLPDGIVAQGQVMTGHGEPGPDILGVSGLQYVDLDTGTVYQWSAP